MPSTLDLCEKYYGTRDIYKLMDIKKDALEKDVKKAYYKLSLQVHPDRVAEADKEEATEKFKILTKIHGVLTDPPRKALYDEQGIVDDDDGDLSGSSWMDMWRQFFKPITTTDIENYQKEYEGSETEARDIRKAYLARKGCINYMMECVPFMSVEDEPRIIELVKQWIAAGDVPEYKLFTEEPKAKRQRRHKKYSREALEARELQKEMETKEKQKKSGGSLQDLILARQTNRAANADNFFDALLAKYGGNDDSEDYVFEGKKSKKSKKPTTPAKKGNGKGPEHRVKSGRVKK